MIEFETTIGMIFTRMEDMIMDNMRLQEKIQRRDEAAAEYGKIVVTTRADLTVAKQELEMVRNQRDDLSKQLGDDLSKQLDYRRAGDKSVFDLFRAAQAVLESENAGEPRSQLRKAISRMSSAMLVAEGVRR